MTYNQKTLFATITGVSSFVYLSLQAGHQPVNWYVIGLSFLVFVLSYLLLLLLEREDEYGWAGMVLFLGQITFLSLAYGMLFKSICDEQPPFGP